MISRISKTGFVLIIAGIAVLLHASLADAKELKIGYVDIRRAYYEYERTKVLEEELAAITEKQEKEKKKLVEELTKLNGETELLTGKAKAEKQRKVDEKYLELEEFDKNARQERLGKQNDILREVMPDIQDVAVDIGKKGGYDFIIDSRNVMYAEDKYDLTEEVVKRLNKR